MPRGGPGDNLKAGRNSNQKSRGLVIRGGSGTQRRACYNTFKRCHH